MREMRFCLRAGLLAIVAVVRSAVVWAADSAPSTAAPTPPPTPAATAATLQLAPNSVGAALLVWAEEQLQSLGDATGQLLQTVTDFPLLWAWLQRLATDPQIQAQILAATWRLALVMALGVGAEMLVRRVLRRAVLALRRNVPAGPGDEVPEELQGIDEAEQGQTEAVPRRADLMLMLRRVPYLVGALLLDLAPILALAAMGFVLIASGLARTQTSRLVILTVLNAYTAWRLILVVMRLLAAPNCPKLRLLPLNTQAARLLVHDVSLLSALSIGGYAVAEDGLLFGLTRPAHDALLKLVALAVLFVFGRAILRVRRRVKAALRAPEGAKGPVAMLRNALAGGWHRLVLFYASALWVVWVLGISHGFDRVLIFTVEIIALGAALRMANLMIRNGFERLLAIAEGLDDDSPGIEARLGSYHGVARMLADLLLGLVGLLCVAAAAGFDVGSWFGPHSLGERLASAAENILVTLLIALVVWETANIAVERHLAGLNRTAQLSRAARLRTLLPMLRTTLLATVVVVCALVVLSEIGVNIAPLLAGAGVLGLAIGFGSQKLVQDIITGLFLLLENTMQVGDVVSLGGMTGTVENLSIRTIRLRATDGSVHIVPFSAVTTVTNMTRDYSYAVVDINIGVNEEPERVIEVLQGIATELRAEQPWRGKILADLEVIGIDHFLDLGYVLRVRIKTLPGAHWPVGRELNLRIKHRFDALAIESPITSHRALGVETVTHATIIGKSTRPTTKEDT